MIPSIISVFSFWLLVSTCAASTDDTLTQLKANNYEVPRTLVTYATCHVGDLSCSADCASVELCTAGGNHVTLEECTSNEICDAASLTCRPIGNGTCIFPPNEDDFKCNAVGSFPNPYNCHKYHFCYEARAYLNISYVCEGSFAYDPLTTLCILGNQDRVCRENPIPSCERAGQSGPQQENPNIYYICVKDGDNLAPWLFRCPHDNEIFDGNDCVPRGSTTPSSTTWTTATPTTTWTTATPSTTWTTATPTTTRTTTTPTTTRTTATPTTTWSTTNPCTPTTPTRATTTPTTATTTPTTATTTPTTATTTPTTATTTPTTTWTTATPTTTWSTTNPCTLTTPTTATTTPTRATTTPTTVTTTPTTATTTSTTATTTPTTATTTPTTGTTTWFFKKMIQV